MTMSHDKVVLVDYGGVLGDHHQVAAELELASELAVSRAKCRELLSERSDAGREFREDRISEREFWDRVCSQAGLDVERRPDDARLSLLWAETYRLNTDVLAILCKMRRAALVGVLTNIDRARSAYLVNVVKIDKAIDLYLPSYMFGAIKPKAELWRRATDAVEERIGGAAHIVYVDDRDTHVRACAEYGWEGIQYDNLERFRACMAERGLLV